MESLNRRRLFRHMLSLVGLHALSKVGVHELASVFAGPAFADELVGGSLDRYYIEIGLRDQWDFAHVFVAPGLGSHSNLMRGEGRDTAALYFDQSELLDLREKYNVFLTPDSKILAPHMDHIAVIEVCELPIGIAHGHEASGPLRIPGRSREQKAGMIATYVNDGIGQEYGNQVHYGNCPTLTCLYNYLTKKQSVNTSANNGIYLFGNGVVDHKVNQFDYDLPVGGKLDRFHDIASFLQHLALIQRNLLPNAREVEEMAKILRKLDADHLAKHGFAGEAIKKHQGHTDAALAMMYRQDLKKRPLSLSPDELARWDEGVPPHDLAYGMKFSEQAAYAAMMVRHDVTRAIALAYDHDDVHGPLRQKSVRVEGQQFATVLARLIEQLKADGTFDKTLIAVYTVDGSRGARSDSHGNEGKNSVVLVGGGVKGGYYGDIRVTGNKGDGHTYAYFAPDQNGRPRQVAAELMGDGNRVMGKDVWVTVAQMLGITARPYEPLRDAQVLSYVMR